MPTMRDVSSVSITEQSNSSEQSVQAPDAQRSRKKPGELAERWPLVMATCIGIISSAFVLPYYTIGALTVPITEEFGWSRTEFQAAILFSSGIGALLSPTVGWLNDRFGPRRIALPSMLGLGFAFLLAATMQGQLWMLFLAYGAMAFLGAGTIPVTWTRAIATSFFHRRGLALGLSLMGTGICAAVAPHYTVWLTDSFGWRGAYVGLALIPLLLAWPVLFFFFKPRETPVDESGEAEPQSGLTLGEALRGYRFWILLVAVLVSYMGFSGIGPNLLPAMTDDGLSRESAATIQSIFGLSIILGRVVVGYIIDHHWAPGVASVCLLISALGAFLFIGEQTFWAAAIASLALGFAAGAELDLLAFLAARYFGLAHYAKIYAILYLALAMCSGTAPMLFASVFDLTSSYDWGFGIASILFIIGSGIMLLLGKYPREFGEH
jgi:OFA family oxalate/formate antiporter-like MFS transporter